MFQFPIGVMLNSFQTGVDEALKSAQSLGVQGIQVPSAYGPLSPAELRGAARREFLRKVKDHGLMISALCGDLGHGFGKAEENPALIETSMRILDLAKELETDVVTTHIGVVPENPAHPRYGVMQEACQKLADYADQMQAHFAIETGPETAVTLKRFLDGLHSKGVAVNLDPANLVMVTGDDPVQAVHTLSDYIVHTHAKDGRRLLVKEPEVVYGVAVDDNPVVDQAFIELPLGEGDVPFAEYLKALEAVGYRGFLTIEREVGNNPAADIALAARFLREKMR